MLNNRINKSRTCIKSFVIIHITHNIYLDIRDIINSFFSLSLLSYLSITLIIQALHCIFVIPDYKLTCYLWMIYRKKKGTEKH